MKKFDPISWVLVAPVIPLFKALFESKGEANPKVNLIMGLYGYLVFCGVIFNLFVLYAVLSVFFK